MASGAGIHRRQIADRQISPLKRYLSLLDGKYIEEYFNYQPRVSAPNGYGDPSGVDTESFRVALKNGGDLLGTYIGTGTQLAPILTDGVLQLSLDEAASDGVEYNPGITQGGATAYGPMVLVRGAQAPHFVRAKFKVADVSEVTYCAVGYREEAAVAPVFDNYTDLGAIRLDNGNVKIETITNNAATVSFDTLQDVLDGVEFELKAVLESFGVRFFFNGKEYGSKFALHSSVTRVIPFIYLFQEAAGAGSVISCSELQAGYLSDVDDHRIL
jgi:hypothetical protein